MILVNLGSDFTVQGHHMFDTMGQEVISNKSENPDESLVWIFLASCNE